MPVRITTLGTLRIELDGRILDRLPAARNRSALLVHLAVEREVTRDSAMALLWPDRPPDRARHLLSQTLYELRQELGESWMETAGERLRATAELDVDVREMEAALEAGDFDRALSLYGGPFLPGSALAVSRPMEGWIEGQQARLGRLHRRARRGAVSGHVEAGRPKEALALARAWAEIDPLDDEAQHRLIELLAATGDRSGALRQYDRYAALVESELELEPLEQTRELVERIRQGEVGRREPAPDSAAEDTPPEPSADAGPAPSPAPSPAPVQDGEGAPAPGTEAEPVSPLDAFLDRMARLRHRRTVQWTLTYLAAAVVLLEGLDILTDAFGLPPGLLRVVALLLAMGSIVVLGTSWYLADPARSFGKPEAALTLLVAVFVLSLPAWFQRATPAPVSAEDALDPSRIAVLYFDDMSPDQSLEPLAQGFTEALIHKLSQVKGLHVLSRRAVAPFKENPELPYDSLVNTLDAGTLVEGSLTRLGDRIRLTIQLIDGATAAHLMSATLQSAADSTDQLLEAMPEEAGRMLRRRLGDWVRLQKLETEASSAVALELVQRAEPLIEDAVAVRTADLQASLPLLERADSMLAEASRLDPDWPQPTMIRVRVAETRALATAAVPSQYAPEPTLAAFDLLDQVLTNWPDYAPALAYRGNLRFGLAETGFGDQEEVMTLYAQAEADLRKALLLDDGLTDAWWGLSKLLYHLGQDAEALRAALRAIETDAFLTSDRDNLWHIFNVAFEAEDHSTARHWCDELEVRFAESQQYPYCELFMLTTSPIVAPDVNRAWEMARTIVDRANEADREVYQQYVPIQVAKVLVRAGDPDSAQVVVARAFPDSIPGWATYDLAHLHLMMGADEEALDLLDRWAQHNPVRAQRVAHDWWFRRLQGNPRFDRLVGRGAG